MTTEKPQKNPYKFSCEFCDFYTSNKKDFTRHSATDKHKNSAKTTGKPQKTPPDNSQNNEIIVTTTTQSSSYNCPYCEKPHKDRTGLWRHKNKCTKNPSQFITVDVVMEILRQNKEVQTVLIEQHTEAQNVLIEQNNKLMEKINTLTQGNTITNNTNTNTNTNSHNSNFNEGEPTVPPSTPSLLK